MEPGISRNVTQFFTEETNRDVLRRLEEVGVRVKEMSGKEKTLPYKKKTFVFTGKLENHIEIKMEKRKESLSNMGLDSTIQKYEKAKAKLKDLERANENTWKHVKLEIDNLYDDINEDLREMLAYFG
jgi:hypothetical protein